MLCATFLSPHGLADLQRKNSARICSAWKAGGGAHS